MSANVKDLKKLQDELEERGWVKEKCGSGNWKYTHKKTGQFFFSSATPSDNWAMVKIDAEAKRLERQSGLRTDSVPGKVVHIIEQKDKREKMKPRSKMSRGQKIEYNTDPRDTYPNLPALFTLEAFVIDKNTIKVILPDDFIGISVVPEGNENRRVFRITVNDEGHSVIKGGYEEGVAMMRTDLIKNLRPGAKSFWHAKRNGGTIMIGTLLDFLSTDFRKPERDEGHMLDTPTPIPHRPFNSPFAGVVDKLATGGVDAVKKGTESGSATGRYTAPAEKATIDNPIVEEHDEEGMTPNRKFLLLVVEHIGWGGVKRVADICGVAAVTVTNWKLGHNATPDWAIEKIKEAAKNNYAAPVKKATEELLKSADRAYSNRPEPGPAPISNVPPASQPSFVGDTFVSEARAIINLLNQAVEDGKIELIKINDQGKLVAAVTQRVELS